MKHRRPLTSRPSSLTSYFAVAGLYLLLLTVLKVVEYFLWGIDAPNRFQVFVNAVVYNLVVASWTVLAVGLLYGLVQLLSRRAAVVLAAVCYALLLLSEVGLLFYALHNGYLLGSELCARPLSESLLAVRGAVGLLLPISLPLLLVGGFVALALWRARKASRAAWATPVVVGALVLLSLIFKMSHLVYNRYNYFILNKTNYLVADSVDYLRHPGGGNGYGDSIPDYDAALVADLLATHPEWGTPLDSTYPLERPFVPDTFLNPYFKTLGPDAAPPNVVLIIVESMGHEFMGSGAMPFVDSLAATGLYWPNCISATTRSYGAVPALTGSVGGPKSFQFGTMPAHNSLLSLLREEGYNTRAYYSGDFSFDCIYDYLTAQHIDYLSPLFEEFDTLPFERKPNWWGFPDDTLFARFLRDLHSQSSTHKSQFSILTTLSMHDPLKLVDSRRQASYERRAGQLPARPEAGFYPACLFTDDALRDFFRQYRRRPDFANTLFVITGDHASSGQTGDKLSFHHVPLILWSPLVERPVVFPHPVTHNDVAPALYSLLTAKYGLHAHPTVHWLGDGLGPSPKTLLVVNYAWQIRDIVFHNHYYKSGDRFEPEELYSFGPDLLLRPVADPSALDSCRRQLELMRYLYSYTYLADRLTAHPLAARHYTLAHVHRLPKPVTCVIPDTLAADAGSAVVTVLPSMRLRGTEGYTSVRITFDAAYEVEGFTSWLQYPRLTFSFDGDSRHQYEEDLYRLVVAEGRIKAIKEFSLSTARADCLNIEMRVPYSDENWCPGGRATLSDIKITFEYGK